MSSGQTIQIKLQWLPTQHRNIKIMDYTIC